MTRRVRISSGHLRFLRVLLTITSCLLFATSTNALDTNYTSALSLLTSTLSDRRIWTFTNLTTSRSDIPSISSSGLPDGTPEPPPLAVGAYPRNQFGVASFSGGREYINLLAPAGSDGTATANGNGLPSTSTQGWTMSFWVYSAGLAQPTEQEGSVLLSCTTSSSPTSSDLVLTINRAGQLLLKMTDNTTNALFHKSDTVRLLNLWHRWIHVAMVSDKVGGQIRTYLNGIQTTTWFISLGQFSLLTSTSCYLGGRTTLRIWSRNMSPFRGSIYALAVFTNVLSPTQIEQLAAPHDPISVISTSTAYYNSWIANGGFSVNSPNTIIPSDLPWRDFTEIVIPSSYYVDLVTQSSASLTTIPWSSPSQSWTLAWWMKFNYEPTVDGVIFDFRDSAGTFIFQVNIIPVSYQMVLTFGKSPLDETFPFADYALGSGWFGMNNNNRPVTEWNHFTLQYDANQKSFISFINGIQYQTKQRVNTVGANVLTNQMLIGKNANPTGAPAPSVDISIMGLAMWMDTAVSSDEIYILSEPHQQTYVHDAPASVVAGSNIVINLRQVEQLRQKQLIVMNVLTDSSTIIASQLLSFTLGTSSIPISIFVPTTASTLTIQFSFPIGSTTNEIVLPQPICIEVIAMDMITSDVNGYTLLTLQQYVSLADFSYTPPKAENSHPNGCSVGVGASDLKDVTVASCTTAAKENHVFLDSPAENGGLVFPQFTNPYAYSISVWFQTFDTSPSPYVFSTGSSFTLQTDRITLQFSSSGLLNFYATSGLQPFCFAPAQRLYNTTEAPWWHVGIVLGNGGCTMYINGEMQIAAGVHTSFGGAWFATVTPLPNTPVNRTYVRLGGYPFAVNSMKGAFASFTMWNRALESREIAFLAANPPTNVALPTGTPERISINTVPTVESVRSRAVYYMSFSRAPLDSTHGKLLSAPSGLAGYSVLQMDGSPNTGISLLASDDTTEVGRTFPLRQWTTLPGSGRSISLWYKYDGTTPNPPILLFRASDSSSPSSNYWELQHSSTVGGEFIFTMSNVNNPGSLCKVNIVGPTRFVATWNQIGAQWDGDTSECSLWWNGLKVAASTMASGQPVTFIPLVVTIGSPSATALFAEFVYYERALTAQEMRVLAMNPPRSIAVPSTVASSSPSTSPSFAPSAADVILGSSDYNFEPHAAITNWTIGVRADMSQLDAYRVLSLQGGPTVPRVQLNAAGQVETLMRRPFPFLSSATITVSLWVQRTRNTTDGCLVSFSDESGGYVSADRISIDQQNNVTSFRLTARLSDTDLSQQVCFIAAPTNALQVGVWSHIVGVLDEKDRCRLYINSALVASSDAIPLQSGTLPALHYGVRQTTRFTAAIGKCGMNDPTRITYLVAQMTMWQRGLNQLEVAALSSQPPPSIARLVNPQLTNQAIQVNYQRSVPPPTVEWRFTQTTPHYFSTNGYANINGASNQYVDLTTPLDNPSSTASINTMPLIGGSAASITVNMWMQFPTSAPTIQPVRLFECSQPRQAGSVGSNALIVNLMNDLSILAGHSLKKDDGLDGGLELVQTDSNVVKIDANQWFMISVVWNVDERSTRIFVNSAFLGYGNWPYPPPLTPRSLCTLTRSMDINAVRINMNVASFAYWNSALTPKQIVMLYNSLPVVVLQTAKQTRLSRLILSAASTFAFSQSVGVLGLTDPVYSNHYLDFIYNTQQRYLDLIPSLNSAFNQTWPAHLFTNQLTDGLSITMWLRWVPTTTFPLTLFDCSSTAIGTNTTRFTIDALAGGRFRMFSRNVRTGSACVIQFDSYTIQPFETIWHHYTFVLTSENLGQLYVDGVIQPNQNAPSTCIRTPQLTAQIISVPLFSTGSRDRCRFGSTGDSQSLNGFKGHLGMIQYYSRVLVQSEMELLSSTLPYPDLNTSFIPPPPAASDDLATATYIWKFQSAPMDSLAPFTLITAPTRVGTIALLSGTQSYLNLVVDNGADYSQFAAGEKFPTANAAIAIWVKWLGLENNDGTNPTSRLTLLDFINSAGDTRITIFVQQSVSGTVGSYLYLIKFDYPSHSDSFQTQPDSVKVDEWQHIVLTIDSSSPTKYRLYLDGSLSVVFSSTGIFPPTIPSQFLIGQNSTQSSKMALQLASVAVWNNIATQLYADTVARLFFNPPPNIAGLLGNAAQQLLRSAAALYLCSAPQVNVTTDTIGWSAGDTPGTGFCALNGFMGSIGSYIDLNDVSNAELVLPSQLTSDLLLLGKKAGMTLSFHFTMSAVLNTEQILFSCANSGGELQASISVRFIPLSDQTFEITFLAYDYSSAPLMSLSSLILKYSEYPPGSVLHLMVTGTSELPQVWTMYVQNVYNNAIISASMIPLGDRTQCFIGKTAVSSTTQGNFGGTFGRFAFWQRPLSASEMLLLQTNPPEAYVPANRIISPDPAAPITHQDPLSIAISRRPTCANRRDASRQNPLLIFTSVDTNLQYTCPLTQSDPTQKQSFTCAALPYELTGGWYAMSLAYPSASVSVGTSSLSTLISPRASSITSTTITSSSSFLYMRNETRLQSLLLNSASWSFTTLNPIPPGIRWVTGAYQGNKYITINEPNPSGTPVGQPPIGFDLMPVLKLDTQQLFVCGSPPATQPCGFTTGGWVLLSRQRKPNDVVFQISTSDNKDRITFVHVSNTPVYSRYEFQIASYSPVKCVVDVQLADTGSWTHIMLRYTHVQAQSHARVSIHQNGRMIGQSECQGQLSQSLSYNNATLSSTPSTGHIMSVAKWEVYSSSLLDSDIASIFDSLPPSIRVTDWMIDAPSMISALNPVVDVIIQPMRHDGIFLVELNVQESNGVYLSPSNRLQFMSSSPQTLHLIISPMATSVTLTFTMSGTGAAYYNTPSPLCINVYNPSQVLPFNQDPKTFLTSSSFTLIPYIDNSFSFALIQLSPLATDDVALLPGGFNADQSLSASAVNLKASIIFNYQLWPILGLTLPLSLNLWYIQDGSSGTSSEQQSDNIFIFHMRSSSGADLRLVQSGGGLIFSLSYAVTTFLCTTSTPSSNVVKGRPVMVTLVADTTQCSLSISGVRVATSFPTGYAWSLGQPYSVVFGSSFAGIDSDMIPYRFAGKFVSLSVFNRTALTEAQVAALSQILPGAIQYTILPVQSPSSNIEQLLDSTIATYRFTRAQNASVTLAKPYYPAAIPSGYVTGDGVSTSISLSSTADQAYGQKLLSTTTFTAPVTSFSYVFWLRFDSLPLYDVSPIFECASDELIENAIQLFTTTQREIVFRMYMGEGLQGEARTSAAAYSLGRWFSLVISQGEVSEPTLLYINGQLAGYSSSSLYIPVARRDNNCYLMANAARSRFTSMLIGYFAFRQAPIKSYQAELLATQPPASVYRGPVTAMLPSTKMYGECSGGGGAYTLITVLPNTPTDTIDGSFSSIYDGDDSSFWYARITNTGRLFQVFFAFSEVRVISHIRLVQGGLTTDSYQMQDALRVHVYDPVAKIASFTPFFGTQTPFLYTLPKLLVKNRIILLFEYQTPIAAAGGSLQTVFQLNEISFFGPNCPFTPPVISMKHDRLTCGSNALSRLYFQPNVNAIGSVMNSLCPTPQIGASSSTCTFKSGPLPLQLAAPVSLAIGHNTNTSSALSVVVNVPFGYTSGALSAPIGYTLVGTMEDLMSQAYARWSWPSVAALPTGWSIDSWQQSGNGAKNAGVLLIRGYGARTQLNMTRADHNPLGKVGQQVIPSDITLPFTLHMFILIDSSTSTTSNSVIFSMLVEGPSVQSIQLVYNTFTHFTVVWVGSKGTIGSVTSDVIPQNVWVSLLLSVDAQGLLTLRIDGAPSTALNYGTFQATTLLSGKVSILGLGDILLMNPPMPVAQFNLASMQWYTRLLSENEQQMLARNPPPAVYPISFMISPVRPTYFTSTNQVILVSVSLTRYMPGTTTRLVITPSPGCTVQPSGGVNFNALGSRQFQIALGSTNNTLPLLSVSVSFSLFTAPGYDTLNYVAPDPLCFGVAERSSASTSNAQTWFSMTTPHLFVNFNTSIGPAVMSNVPLRPDGIMMFAGSNGEQVNLALSSDTRVTDAVANNNVMPTFSLTTTGFTIMMWLRQDAFVSNPACVFDMSPGDSGTFKVVRITTTPDVDALTIMFGMALSTAWSLVTPSIVPKAAWVHVTITLTAVDPIRGQLLSVYANGIVIMEQYAPIDIESNLGSPNFNQFYLGHCTPSSAGTNVSPKISLASFMFLPTSLSSSVIASIAGEVPVSIPVTNPPLALPSSLSDVSVKALESYSFVDTRQQIQLFSPSFQCAPLRTSFRGMPGLLECLAPVWNATQHTVSCDLKAQFTSNNLFFRVSIDEYIVPLNSPVPYQIIPTYYHAFQTLSITVPSNPTTPLTQAPSLTPDQFRYNLAVPVGEDTLRLAFTFNASTPAGTPFRVRIDDVAAGGEFFTPLSSVTLPPLTSGMHTIRFGSFELGTIVMNVTIDASTLSYLKLSGVVTNGVIPLTLSPSVFSPSTPTYLVQTSELITQLQFTYPIYGDDLVILNGAAVPKLIGDVNPKTASLSISPGVSDVQLSVYYATTQDTFTYTFTVNVSSVIVTPPGSTLVSAPVVVVAPQPVFYAGGVVVLRAVATTIDPLTVRSSLIWRWDAIGSLASFVNISLFVYANATASTATLVLNPAATQLLTIGQEYNVRVSATDGDPTHFLAGESSAARAIGTTLVRFNVSKPIDLNVVGPPENPCTTASNPCQNGGACSAVRISADGVAPIQWLMSCSCPVAPITFYGLTCSFALVGCPNCISKYRGNQTLTLLGIGLDATVGMTIGVGGVSGGSSSIGGFKIDPLNLPYTIRGVDNQDVAIAIQSLQSVSNQFIGLTSLQAITFISPSLVKPLNDSAVTRRLLLSTRLLSRRGSGSGSSGGSSSSSTSKQQRQQQHVSLEFDENDDGSVTYIENPISAYQTLRVSVALPLATTLQSIDYTNLIFYASSQCLSIGEFIPDGEGGCLACPDGGYCPGGGRVWPQPGYWSYGEYYKPLKCRIPTACTGIDPLLAGTSSDGTAPYFQQGQKCSPGYQGVRCGQCTDDYYQLNEQCAYCGSSTNQNAAITLTVIAAIVVVTILALGVAFFDAWHLARYVAIFCILQEVALVGVVASRDLPRYSKELSAFFTYFNLINFELEILRPGCAGVPSFTFVDKYWSTLLFMFFACVFFALTCLGRYMMKKSQWARLTKLHADRHKEETEIQAKGVSGALTQVQVYQAMTALPPLKPMPYFPPREDLKHRLRHSWLILLSIFYLRMCILLFKSFKCEYAPNPILSTASNAVVTYSKYLSEDLQTECFVDGHLGIVIVSLILCVFYVIGFPVFCFVLLSRAFATEYESGITGWMYNKFACLHDDSSGGSGIVTFFAQTKMQWLHALRVEQKDEERRNQRVKQSTGGSAAVAMTPVVVSDDDIWTEYRESAFGFLYMYLRPEYFAACMRIYLANISFALITVFVDDDTKLKLFLFGLTSAIMTMSIAIQLPYDTTERNFRKVLIGCVALGHSGLMLAIQSSGPQSGYFAVLVIVLCLIAILLVFREKLPCLKKLIAEERHQKHLKAMEKENRIGGEEDDVGDYLPRDDNKDPSAVEMHEITIARHGSHAKLATPGPSSSPSVKAASSSFAAASGDVEMAPMSPSASPPPHREHFHRSVPSDPIVPPPPPPANGNGHGYHKKNVSSEAPSPPPPAAVADQRSPPPLPVAASSSTPLVAPSSPSVIHEHAQHDFSRESIANNEI